ncbi:unnamed protein product, partial [Mesorhabditis belari]|uniref:Uncharacterized protein n=1 Tax=Mesorhabditis belari TaxID=2138241 RepID=A0AAF3EHC3_9BILA
MPSKSLIQSSLLLIYIIIACTTFLTSLPSVVAPVYEPACNSTCYTGMINDCCAGLSYCCGGTYTAGKAFCS